MKWILDKGLKPGIWHVLIIDGDELDPDSYCEVMFKGKNAEQWANDYGKSLELNGGHR